MSLISFLKEAGEKLFRHTPEQAPAAPAAAAASPPNVAQLNETAGAAIEKYIAAQGLKADGLDVKFGARASGPVSTYYIFKAGDTLSGIAKEVYGNANAYMKIFNANTPMLSDPSKIYTGQTLRVPAA